MYDGRHVAQTLRKTPWSIQQFVKVEASCMLIYIKLYSPTYLTTKVAQKSITNEKIKVTGQGQEVCTSTYSHKFDKLVKFTVVFGH